MGKLNHIGHCTEGNSDKVYIVAAIKNADGTYSCEGRYGRRNGSLKVDVKISHVSRGDAIAEANKLIDKKFHRRKGAYVDIDSREYSGSLTRQDPWLRRWVEEVDGNTPAPAPVPTPTPAPQAPKPVQQESDVLVCINNAGIEDQFDEGVEYFVKKYDDEDFVQVIDKYNEVRSVFRERFAAPEMA